VKYHLASVTALAVLLLPALLPAQITFIRTYGGEQGDGGWSVQQTAEGGYVVAGFTYSFGSGGADFYFIKTDSLGNVPVAVEEPREPTTCGLRLTVSPNPTRGSTILHWVPRSLDPLVPLRIFDSSGRLILHSSLDIGNSSFPLDLTGMPAGIYLLQLEDRPMYEKLVLTN